MARVVDSGRSGRKVLKKRRRFIFRVCDSFTGQPRKALQAGISLPFQMVPHEPGDDFLGVGGDLALQEIGLGLRLRRLRRSRRWSVHRRPLVAQSHGTERPWGRCGEYWLSHPKFGRPVVKSLAFGCGWGRISRKREESRDESRLSRLDSLRHTESWISCGVDFPTYGRKASACLSRGISTGACHTRSTRRQTNRMRDKPLSGWTDISTPPVVDRAT